MSFKLLKNIVNSYNKGVKYNDLLGVYFLKITSDGIPLANVSIRLMESDRKILEITKEIPKNYTTATARDLVSELIINEIVRKGLTTISEENV